MEWTQILIAFFVGVFTSAAVKGFISSAKAKVA